MTGYFVYRSAATSGQTFYGDVFRDDFDGVAGDLNGRVIQGRTWNAGVDSYELTGDGELQRKTGNGEMFAWVQTNSFDVDISTQQTALGDGVLIFNRVDSGNLWLLWVFHSQNYRRLYCRIEGNYPTEVAVGGSTLPSNGDIYRVLVSGDNVKTFRNGVQEINYTETNRRHKLGRSHGFRYNAGVSTWRVNYFDFKGNGVV